jgi:integrase
VASVDSRRAWGYHWGYGGRANLLRSQYGGIVKLTDKTVKAFISAQRKRLEASEKPQKLADGGGLYITVTRAGTGVWRYKYRIRTKEQDNPREKVYAIGTYPEVGLAEARAERDRAKALVRAGENPVQARRVARAAAVVASSDTFAAVAAEWLDMRKSEWSPGYAADVTELLERDALPSIGTLPVSQVAPPMVAKLIQRVVKRGAPSQAPKLRNPLERIFDFAISRGMLKAGANPVASMDAVMPRKKASKSFAALRTFEELGNLLRRSEAANVSASVRVALRLLAFTGGGSRPNNVVRAEWSEFMLDGDAPNWTVPRAKMKAHGYRNDHVIALGPTIASEMRRWRLASGGSGVCFPPPFGTAATISLEGLEKVYRTTLGMRDRHSPHSWRSSFSTLANEAGFDSRVIELALDHLDANKVARAYNHARLLDDRRALAQWWDSALVAAQNGETPSKSRLRKVG